MERDAPIPAPLNRPAFLRALAAIGAGAVVGSGPLTRVDARGATLTGSDRAILRTAVLAEALAVTAYTHIIATAPFYGRLFPQDQTYLQAARQQEMAHYLLVRDLVGADAPSARFFYPKGMFASARTTLDTMVTLEETFIAAYLVGVRDFSIPELRVAAARIMGVESDHRIMARVMAPGIDPQDGGPLRTVAGAAGVAEAVDPASDNGFERTLGWTRVDQAIAALRPFADPKAAAAVGFDTARPYRFQPFTPTLPTGLGAF